MRKRTDYTLYLITGIFLFAALVNLPACYNTPPSVQIIPAPPLNCDCGEYQLTVSEDGVIVYDGERKVGFLPYSNSALDSLIINDNQ